MSDFTREEIDAIYRVIASRRDMRHFRPGPIDDAVLARLLHAAHLAPSVGFMQPWRFIRLRDTTVRERLHAMVEAERQATAQALGERGAEFLRLKVEGIRECAEVLVAALCDARDRHVFGRRTMPEMDLASVACAIQNMWLAARAEGIGMGWVSMFDPDAVRTALRMPDGSRPVAVLCLGHVDAFYDRPMLEREGWAQRADLKDLMYTDFWGASVAGAGAR